MKVRMHDIAKQAGVSAATVSNALNGKGGVGSATAKRIHAIARELGYVFDKPSGPSNGYIRFVVFKRHGLVVMDTQFFAELTEGISRECRKNGMEVIITHLHMQKDADYLTQIHEICTEDCAGILLLATELYPDDVNLFAHTKAPLVVLDSMFFHQDFNCVVMSNYEAGYIATERFIRLGHTRIDHITSSARFNNIRYRRQGYEDAMRENKLNVGPEQIWRVTPTLEGAYEDMRQLLAQRKEPLPTAFFVANDITAVGCVRALQEQGVRIPEDVSIIGMDDLAICQIVNPPLSTIRVFREDICRIAIRRLVEMIDSNTSRIIQKTIVGVTLVDRKSIRDLRDI